jgi:TolA-binding protein
MVVAIAVVLLLPLHGMTKSLTDTWQAALSNHLAKKYIQSNIWLEKYLERIQDEKRIDAARFFMAENYRLLGQSENALLLYQSLAISTPNGPLKTSARFREGELAYNRGKFQQAVGIFNGLAGDSQAEFLYPQIPIVQVKTNLKLNRIPEARRVFTRLIEKFPRSLLDPEIKFLYGIMKEYEKNPFAALKIYEELSGNPLAKLFGGAILEAQGRFLAAIEAYNTMLDMSPTLSQRKMAEYFKIRAFYKSGDYLSADNLSRLYLSNYPKSTFRSQAALLRVLILLAQSRFTEVLEAYPKYTQDFAALPSEDQSLLNYALAEASLNLDRNPEAIALYTRAITMAGKQYRSEMLLHLAYAQLAVRDWEEAFIRINEYFRQTSEPLPFAYLISVQAHLGTRREQGAFRAVKTLVQAKSDMAQVGLYFLAAYYTDKGEIKKLLTQWALLEKALKKGNPHVEFREVAAWSRLLVAEAYFKMDKYLLARDYYQKAMLLYPHDNIEIGALAGLIWCSFKMKEYGHVQSQSERLFVLQNVPKKVKTEIALIQAHADFNLQAYAKAIRAYRHWLESSGPHPSRTAVWFQIGWAYYLDNAFLDAVETWKTLAKKYPESPETKEALFWIADTYFQAGENEQARKVFEDLITKYPESTKRSQHTLRIAQTYYNEQKDKEAIRRFTAIMLAFPETEEAQEAQNGIEAASYRIADRMDTIPVFREFIEKFPESPLAEDIQYRVGEAYYFKEMYAESLKEFAHFVVVYTKSPRTPNSQYYIAVCQEQLGNAQEAKMQAEAFVTNYPQHELAPEMMFRLASGEFQLEEYGAASEHFVACAENYELKEYQPRAWYNAAVTYEKLQLPEQSLVYYKKLIEKYPKDTNAQVSLSRMIIMHAQNQNQAGIQQVLEMLEAQQDKELLQKTWISLAVMYKEQGNTVEHEAMLKKIMRDGLPKAREYSMVLVELASIYEGEKSWPDALRVYRRLAKVTKESKWKQAANKRIKLLQRIIKAGRGKK